LGAVSAFTEPIKYLANCSGLSEPLQLDFIERIHIPDLPPNEIQIFDGVHSFRSEILTPILVWQKTDIAVPYT
jgi:hypothetical protein